MGNMSVLLSRNTLVLLLFNICVRDSLLFRRFRSLRVSGGGIPDGNQFHLEDQGAVGPDRPARPALSVSELRGNHELPLGTNRHELNRLPPSLDDALYWKRRRFILLVGAVKLGAVHQCAPIVAHDTV